MHKGRIVRRAYVEYQPNLQHPQEPIPFGVLAEENSNHERRVVIVGREPKSSVPGLSLDNLWGPFRASITDWIEILDRNVVAALAEIPDSESLVDQLAMQWNANVYIRQPETMELASQRDSLMRYAKRWYGSYVGEPFERRTVKRKPATKTSSSVHRRTAPLWLIREQGFEARA